MSTTQLVWPLAKIENQDGTTSFAEVPTDSDAEVLRAAGLIAATRAGQLDWSPETGVPTGLATIDGPEFAEVLEASLRAQEPRLPDTFYVADATNPEEDGRMVHLVAGIDSVPVRL